MDKVGFYISLPVGPGHVTVAIRHGCDPGEVEGFKDIIRNEIGPLLPIKLRFERDVVLRGYKSDVPTLNVTTDEQTLSIFKDIYRRNYQHIGRVGFPELQMHMTIDKEELLVLADSLFSEHNGEYVCNRATLKKVGDKTVIFEVAILNFT